MGFDVVPDVDDSGSMVVDDRDQGIRGSQIDANHRIGSLRNDFLLDFGTGRGGGIAHASILDASPGDLANETSTDLDIHIRFKSMRDRSTSAMPPVDDLARGPCQDRPDKTSGVSGSAEDELSSPSATIASVFLVIRAATS